MTEATMYYPYGTMETLLKPPVNDNAREKFTGKELDAGENPASEVSFNIVINNFDAGMHYHGELYVNYTDLVYNRSFLKVYPLQYDADADRFILNTADRFPDSMRITNMRISTSGAVSPINYEKACDCTVITDSGLVIALDTSGSALINSSGVNYFTDSTYTPERVAGSNLYYFGARYYDAELGVWGSTDPEDQYYSPYNYCNNNPINYIDTNGKFGWFVWSIGKHGLQIGWQFPNGTGFYSNFGWKDGFSYSTGVTAGVDASFGVKLSAGAQLGTTWHSNGNEWTQDASISAGVGLGGENGGIGIGVSLNLSYSYTNETWTPGWGTSLGLSSSGGTFGGSVGYGGDFQGNNSWNWGANGQFVGDHSDFGINSSRYEEIEGLTAHRIEPLGEDDKFGHYWIESDGKGYGYWPEGVANVKQALTNEKPGQIAFGDDPHYGDRTGHRYKQYKVYAPKGKGAAYYKEQLQGVPVSHFSKQYGVPLGKNCHTYYRNFINRNSLLTVRN